ncbi:MAG: type II secretion system F family protein [Nanoarchaeota archaeon]|nr:type II secretion system F family protein [Nanoarchaeota archaeon]
MKFHIPFTISSVEKLRKKKRIFKSFIKHKKKSKLQYYLNNTETGLTREEYLSICIKGFLFSFIILYVISTTVLAFLNVRLFYLLSLGIALVFSSFVLFSQLVYPKIYTTRKQKNIEKNLIPALEDMLVQLNSGIPLFSILVNISSADYGELSNEFKKAVRKINAGLPEIEVLEELGEKNPSIFFRRTLWQLSNGMKAGSDIAIVIKDSIKSLNEEQLIQIQNYGNKLNPLIMFYMLTSVILPALAITFLTIISSIVNLPQATSIMLYLGLFIFVVFLQIMFLGVIKSARPTLL